MSKDALKYRKKAIKDSHAEDVSNINFGSRAKQYSYNLIDEAVDRDFMHPGVDELSMPSRDPLFTVNPRWKKPFSSQNEFNNLKTKFSLNEPLVSVIIPVYNQQDVIRRCLTSVLGQSYLNLEIILINDGSTDESLAVASWLTQDDPRVTIASQRNKGVSAARNAGLKLAHGQWIYFCDCDDWLEPDCIESLIGGLTSSDVDLAISDFYRVRGNRYDLQCQTVEGVYDLDQFVRHMTYRPANFYYGSLWNKLFRKSVLDEHALTFNESMRYGEDHLFNLDYFLFCKKIVAIAKPLYYYVDTPGSLLHQGLTPSGLAKNKTIVVESYARLCASCGLAETTTDNLKLAGFLIAPATDGVVSPLAKILSSEHIPC